MSKVLQRFISSDGRLAKSDTAGVWVNLINPEQSECEQIASDFLIDIDDLRAALDVEERSRISVEDTYALILVDIPTTEIRNNQESFTTIPLGIILTEKAVVTICLEDTPLIKDFVSGQVRNFNPALRTRFVLQILYRNASYYLQYLRQIDRMTDEVQLKLRRSTRNEELIELLELEKSMVYFSTSLRSNDRVLEKLVKTSQIKKYSDDEELLEDTIVENKQAMEMANIYTSVLSGTMDAFASVIANNQNDIMKLLALITIVMAIPTMIFSAYGMNVAAEGMPLADNPFGFWIIIGVSFVISLITILIFLRKKYF